MELDICGTAIQHLGKVETKSGLKLGSEEVELESLKDQIFKDQQLRDKGRTVTASEETLEGFVMNSRSSDIFSISLTAQRLQISLVRKWLTSQTLFFWELGSPELCEVHDPALGLFC